MTTLHRLIAGMVKDKRIDIQSTVRERAEAARAAPLKTLPARVQRAIAHARLAAVKAEAWKKQVQAYGYEVPDSDERLQRNPLVYYHDAWQRARRVEGSTKARLDALQAFKHRALRDTIGQWSPAAAKKKLEQLEQELKAL